MAIKVDELLDHLRIIAPRELEEEWDNGGFQINMQNQQVKRILVTLEITNAVIEEAAKRKADFVITHHPLLMKKIDVVDAGTLTGNYIVKLIRHGITVYAAHTSFDSVFGGNNDYLADLLDLQKVRRLKVWTPLGDKEIVGRMGTFAEPMTLREAASLVESVLNLAEPPKVVGNPNATIRTVGICTGAGGDSIDAAIENGCDLFITGDVKHHQAQKAREMGLNIIDAGHFGTEYIFTQNFAEKLKKAVGDQVEILESNVIVNPFDSML
ncbi:MAG: Nif3-like dinuclear metal center hexameric protein [Clostridiales bacterium]|nr:Nif3-like dinuclear metal center hexameric protein [Clostridiales bacterium]